MIAVVGQSVIDRVTLPGCPPLVRLGGSPIFAGQAMEAAGAGAVLVTRGATPALRRPLHALGLRVVEGPSTRSCISEMVLHPDGSCTDGFGAFGDPFTPADVLGWMAPGLAGARVVACGAQWRDDLPAETLAALAAGGRLVYLDGQGPLRAPRLGPLALERGLTPALLRHVALLKLAEEEAAVALGGIHAAAARVLGVPTVVVTRGHRGAVALVDGEAIEIGVEPVLGLADTVGAGDAFLALMAVEQTRGTPVIEAAWRACASVASLLRRRLAATVALPGPAAGAVAAPAGGGGAGGLESAARFRPAPE